MMVATAPSTAGTYARAGDGAEGSQQSSVEAVRLRMAGWGVWVDKGAQGETFSL